ncbi:hypothetical protein EJB05_15004, partial [Eragrostis curvula]
MDRGRARHASSTKDRKLREQQAKRHAVAENGNKRRHLKRGKLLFARAPTKQIKQDGGMCETLVTSTSLLPPIHPELVSLDLSSFRFDGNAAAWNALATLADRRLLFSTPLFDLDPLPAASTTTFQGPGPWDRATVEARLDRASLQQWLAAEDGGEEEEKDDDEEVMNRKLLLFSGNDYLCLSSHPAVREAAAKAAQEYGMVPRGSARGDLWAHYLATTNWSSNHSHSSRKKSISSLLAAGRKPSEDERIAIFSDELNRGEIRLAERQKEAVVFVYKHCDMSHLESLLLFSMDGDFAPFPDLVKLRHKYGFLLVVDDAHATLVCGENGGGAPEMFGCENDIDISVGTLSKGVGCLGGFVACSTRWRRLILSRGRSFIFSTTLPLPRDMAISISKQERWRRSVIWGHVRYFASLTKLNVTSPIISIVLPPSLFVQRIRLWHSDQVALALAQRSGVVWIITAHGMTSQFRRSRAMGPLGSDDCIAAAST